MTMQPHPTHYEFVDSLAIWFRRGQEGFWYSDGDATEQRIAEIVDMASDLSSTSRELRMHCTDWPTLYHLSPRRANLMRPFATYLKGDVLELGAGCGAITRFLAECGGAVVAVEPSARRAAIARSRTRDLGNVTVVVDRMETLQLEASFDAVVLVGVLEYAGLGSEDADPFRNALEKTLAHLKPDGVLFLAIENQFGLKYLAGAPEDHVGRPMHGVEDKYRDQEVRTFGRKELTELLRAAGFDGIHCHVPLPDYKLPNTVVMQHGFETETFDPTHLVVHSVRQDPQLPQQVTFAPERAWPAVIRNGLGIDLANSFLFTASPGPHTTNVGTLAVHYSIDRLPGFRKETAFVVDPAGEVIVEVRPVPPFSPHPGQGPYRHSMPSPRRYAVGPKLDEVLMRIVTRDGWRTSELVEFFNAYFDDLAALPVPDKFTGQTSAVGHLPGFLLDAIPQNLVVTPAGGVDFIDAEWSDDRGVSRARLVFRTLVAMTGTLSRFGVPESEGVGTYGAVLSAVLAELGEEHDARSLELLTDEEAAFQAFVTGVDPRDAYSRWLSAPLHTRDLAASVQALDALTADSEMLRAADSEMLRAHAAALEAQLEEYRRLAASWPLAPARMAYKLLRRLSGR